MSAQSTRYQTQAENDWLLEVHLSTQHNGVRHGWSASLWRRRADDPSHLHLHDHEEGEHELDGEKKRAYAHGVCVWESLMAGTRLAAAARQRATDKGLVIVTDPGPKWKKCVRQIAGEQTSDRPTQEAIIEQCREALAKTGLPWSWRTDHPRDNFAHAAVGRYLAGKMAYERTTITLSSGIPPLPPPLPDDHWIVGCAAEDVIRKASAVLAKAGRKDCDGKLIEAILACHWAHHRNHALGLPAATKYAAAGTTGKQQFAYGYPHAEQAEFCRWVAEEWLTGPAVNLFADLSPSRAAEIRFGLATLAEAGK